MARYVVQKHRKSVDDLHYDLMLEVEGILATWSFPRWPQLELGERIEGTKIFDHRLKYLTFEGEIGRGLGRVDIWDRGEYRWEETGEAGKVVVLEGERIEGKVELVLVEKDRWTARMISS